MNASAPIADSRRRRNQGFLEPFSVRVKFGVEKLDGGAAVFEFTEERDALGHEHQKAVALPR